jgi:hypothetical protein
VALSAGTKVYRHFRDAWGNHCTVHTLSRLSKYSKFLSKYSKTLEALQVFKALAAFQVFKALAAFQDFVIFLFF